MNVVVLGIGHFLGTSAYWDLPKEDSRAYLIGYRYFLAEPWHWPIFEVRTMNVPYPKSIAFTDSIPLWALLNKIVATVIPPWGRFTVRSYLGLWHGLVWALQAVLGLANLRAVGRKRWGDAVCAVLFFLAVPAFIQRYAHASLSAHFLTLWALALYLRSTPASGTRVRRWFVAELVVAALINPYHVAMSFALFLASLLRSRSARTLGMWTAIGAGSVLAAAWFAGYFSGEAATPMPGFDSASANLLSPIIPVRSWLLGDGRSIANVTATKYQYEGYDYLGLGLLALGALAVTRVRTLGAAVRRHVWLFVVALGAWLYSLSNHVYFGSHLVVAYEWPHALRWLCQQYRSPGRFIWLPTYVGMVFVLKDALERFRVGWRAVIVPALALLQVTDGGVGEWLHQRDVTHAMLPSQIDLAGWRSLIAAHDAIDVHPPYDCVLDGTPLVDEVSREIEYVASARTLPINGVYSARPTRDCARDLRAASTARPEPGKLSVFLSRVVTDGVRFEGLGASCGEFRWGRACSLDATSIDAAVRAGALAPSQGATPLGLGEKLRPGAIDSPYVAGGWSFPEGTGRWTDAPDAILVFRMTGAIPAAATLKLRASAVLCGKRKIEDVEVLLGGRHLDTLRFEAGEKNDVEVVRSIPIPDTTPLRRLATTLELRPHDIRPPRAMGCSSEPRSLGVWVRSLWFE